MKIKPDENLIKGKWVFDGSSVKADENSQRIEELIAEYLIEVGADKTGWNKLYQDPYDKRYWELTYPESDSYGGGSPQLKNLSDEEVKNNYLKFKG